MEDIGSKIRELRKDKGLTVTELAKSVGCSPSFISQLERGKVSPSIATLKKITDALGINIVDLFLPTNHREPVVLREHERIETSLKKWRVKVQLLVRSTEGKKMQPFYTIIEPGGGATKPYTHYGEEFGIVLKGELELNLNGRVYRVKENESFYFSSHIPHSWRNVSKGETVVIWVVSPPTW